MDTAHNTTATGDSGWDEVERMAMAMTAEDARIASQYPKPDSIERWKKLFGYWHMEAVRLISDQRGDGKPSLPAIQLSINSHNPQSHASASATTTGHSSKTRRKVSDTTAKPTSTASSFPRSSRARAPLSRRRARTAR
jgi:hypothetical protein